MGKSIPRCNEQVKKLRFQTQLSQNKMANRANIDSATYRRAENGTENVTEMTVERIAMAFTTLLKKQISSELITVDEPANDSAEKSATG